MPSRLKLAVMCFKITAYLSATVGLILLICALFNAIPVFGVSEFYISNAIRVTQYAIALVFILIGLFIRLLAHSLRCIRYWAWFVGLILAGLMILNGLHSPYISTVLGGLALWGLLDKETLAVFLPRPTIDRQSTTEDK